VTALSGWDLGSFTHEGSTFPTYRRGTGPGVVVVHEIPGITPHVETFANEVADAGFTVVLPSLFGTPGEPMGLGNVARSVLRICVSDEFVTLHAGRTSPVTRRLGALAELLHAELGGPGVGALGMCFSGGFALGMMVAGPVVAPVLSQPSMPFPVTKRMRGDLNLSPADLTTLKEKVAAGCPVLGLRYAGDPAVGTRFDTLRQELGDGFLYVELPGKGHSVLTEHRDDASVQRVIDFFRERLLQADQR
jgi:dienelactone hydrolase